MISRDDRVVRRIRDAISREGMALVDRAQDPLGISERTSDANDKAIRSMARAVADFQVHPRAWAA